MKNNAFLKLAEISYTQQKYKDAYAFYDSLQLADTSLGDVAQIKDRKNALAAIVSHLNIIEREDSLQAIAAMSESDRDAFLKKLSKKLRKEQGVTDDNATYGNAASNFFNTKNASSDIFGNVTSVNGDWYFYNTSLKSQGYADFKRKWGKRQNADNWRTVSSGGTPVTNAFANPDASDSNQSVPGQAGDPRILRHGRHRERPVQR